MKLSEIHKEDSLLRHLEQLRPKLINAAQVEYDSWVADDDGYDEEVGYGGICHLIADAICEVLQNNSIDCTTQSSEIGETHVWAVAYDENDFVAYIVDIPPNVYETGAAYTWKKIPNIKFNLNDIYFEPTEWKNVESELNEFWKI